MENNRKINALTYKYKYFDESKSQSEMTMEYMLLFGTITQEEAYLAFDCKRLASVICRLKAHHDILSYRGGKENISVYGLYKKKMDVAIAELQNGDS